MNISFGGFVLPPFTTGHPSALPAEPATPSPASRVAPVDAEASAHGASAWDQREPATAPPSVMQRRIMEFLQAQAEELESRSAEDRSGEEALDQHEDAD